MQQEIEKLKVYILLKWYVILITTLTIFVEIMFGVVGWVAAISSFICLLIIFVANLALQSMVRRGKVFRPLPYISLFFDLVVVITALYFNGGPENTWWFMPVFVIFITGYVFTLRVAIAYAALAFLMAATIFWLEYFSVIPHFGIYDLPVTLWKNREFMIDHLIGIFLLYTAGALISGYFNRLIGQSSQQLENGLRGSETARGELEASRKALLSIMEDLDASKGELEKKVKVRTAELEEAKSGLEDRVKERTADLEESRKAIMHMMRDLKEDIVKLSVVDRMKTEFLSMVSHELRTPLTPIKGYLSLILAGKMGKLTEEQRKALDILQKQADHLHNMIDNILDIARLEVGKPIPTYKTPVSLETIITETADAMQIQAQEKQVKIILNIKGPLPTIIGDENKLKRVMTNLIGNAIKFTPQSGEIKVNSHPTDQEILTEVSDNGIGIARENLGKIFEKFYQVDASSTRTFGGIGMGLPIAKELVELHGGKLWAESDGLGRGSKFIFILPVT